MMPVMNPPAVAGQQPLQVGTITPIDPAGTPAVSVTPTMPQTLTAQIPTGGTKVQKAVVATAVDGTATWTFPTPFQNPPVIACIAEGVVSQVLDCQVTAVSPTSVTVKVSKSTATVNALLGLTILVAVGTPGVTNVHLYAAPNPS